MNLHRKNGKSEFEIMMRECSDTIQELAMAYGERNTLEQSMVMLESLENEGNHKVMEAVFRVYAADSIRKETGFFLRHKAISPAAAKALIATQMKLIKDVAQNIEGLLASLNVPHDCLYVPISQDYEKYYSKPNFGEVATARL